MHDRMIRTCLMALLLMVCCSCATLPPPREGAYPFGATFKIEGRLQGRTLALDGAFELASPETALAQVYGPMGLALYSIRVHDSRLAVMDMWGRTLVTYEAPVSDLFGLLAGDLPDGPFLYRLPGRVRYAWGLLYLDDWRWPKKLSVGGSPGLDVRFERDGAAIRMMIDYGADRLRVLIEPHTGGCWNMQRFDEERQI